MFKSETEGRTEEPVRKMSGSSSLYALNLRAAKICPDSPPQHTLFY